MSAGAGWRELAVRRWRRLALSDERFAFLFDAPPPNEWVALDCETTGLDTLRDRVIAVGAVRIVGSRILTSERLELIVRPERAPSAASVRVHRLRQRDVAQGVAPAEAMHRLLEFIGSRPLVGYYLEFDVAMLNREIAPLIGTGLPQQKIEVSSMYYDYMNRKLPLHERGGRIDLSLARIMDELHLPYQNAHDALADAVTAALIFLKMRQLLQKA